MVSGSTISFRVSTTHPGLIFSVKLDDQVIFKGDPVDGPLITMSLDDTPGSHLLILELQGKTSAHTTLDADGNITQDVTVTVSDLAFDDIELGPILANKALYNHDFNGTAAAIQEKFHGIMGCNGQVQLAFTTPIYLWLLENF